MDGRIIRWKKEARALFLPWCAVLIAGALVGVLTNGYTKKLNLLSFFFGVPLLAALSLGNEFRHGTLSLWLAQPLSRRQLWGEKMSVMIAAALSAALVSGIGVFYFSWLHVDFTWRVATIVCVLMATASAPYLTLATRSSFGGLGLIIVYLTWVALFAFNVAPPSDQEPPAKLSAAAITAISGLGLGIAGLMFWLGARRLARFHVTGGATDADLLMTGPEVMPEVFARWFRCRPTGALRNLIRKEFRLLWPIWQTTLVLLMCLGFAATFRLLTTFPIYPRHPAMDIEFAVFVTLGALFLLMPVFAGVLSLGEERTSGTHAWHMALPVSPRRQWLIKLAIAMLAGFAGCVLLPLFVVIAVGTLLGSPLMFVNFRELRDWMIMVPVMTFASFWCACAANGTIRAVLWLTPVTSAIFVINSVGLRLGQELARTTGTVRDLVISSFHLSPLALASIIGPAPGGLLWLFAPALLLGLIQSYRLFRMQPQDSPVWMLRQVAPLAALTLVWSFSESAGFLASKWEPFVETRNALDKLPVGTEKLELTGEELARGAALTSLTRRWLDGARIIVVPDKAHPAGSLATIRLARGLEYRLAVPHMRETPASPVNQGH